MATKKIKLDKIITDAGTDVRSEINEATVDEYGQAARDKAKFPPLVVFETPQGLLLADGFHRYFGFERQGIKEYDCDIRKGSREEAIKFALGCNTTHGLRRTNADKRNAVLIAIDNWPKMSGRAIAELCVVSTNFACELKKEIEEESEREKLQKSEAQVSSDDTCGDASPSKSVEVPPRKVQGKDGKEYKVPARPGKQSEGKKQQSTMDATGIEVPEEIVTFWDATFVESQRLLNFVSEVRIRVKRAQDTNEPAFREVDHTDIIAKLDQVYADLKRVKPYAVCPDCNGVETKGCTTCKGRGFVSDFFWKNFVPAEKKQVSGRV